MSSENYLVRRDIAQTIRIDELVKDNARLIIQLRDSEAEIGHLRFQVERMEDGTQALTIRLENSIKEVGRMSVDLMHRKQAILDD
jgi:small ligand-binding sensory domain FIST